MCPTSFPWFICRIDFTMLLLSSCHIFHFLTYWLTLLLGLDHEYAIDPKRMLFTCQRDKTFLSNLLRLISHPTIPLTRPVVVGGNRARSTSHNAQLQSQYSMGAFLHTGFNVQSPSSYLGTAIPPPPPTRTCTPFSHLIYWTWVTDLDRTVGV
jgi:hypothetical protein